MLQRQPRARRLGQSVIGIEKVVRPERFEPPTLWFEDQRREIQTAYRQLLTDALCSQNCPSVGPQMGYKFQASNQHRIPLLKFLFAIDSPGHKAYPRPPKMCGR